MRDGWKAGWLQYSIIDGYQQLVHDFRYWRILTAAAERCRRSPGELEHRRRRRRRSASQFRAPCPPESFDQKRHAEPQDRTGDPTRSQPGRKKPETTAAPSTSVAL